MTKTKIKTLSVSFNSRISRLMLLLILIIPICGIFLEYKSDGVISPTNSFYYTVIDNGRDPYSPNGKRIIEKDYKNYGRSFNKDYEEKCDWTKLSDKGVLIVGAEYRGIELCNSANIEKIGFEIRNEYFRNKVDGVWTDYYIDHLNIILIGVGNGLVVWAFVLAFILAYRWVMLADK